MTIEQDKEKGGNKMIQCSWCGMIDERKKVYYSPGDDLENPGAYHEECFKALNYFIILASTESDESTEQMIKLANRLAGLEIKVRKSQNGEKRIE